MNIDVFTFWVLIWQILDIYVGKKQFYCQIFVKPFQILDGKPSSTEVWSQDIIVYKIHNCFGKCLQILTLLFKLGVFIIFSIKGLLWSTTNLSKLWVYMSSNWHQTLNWLIQAFYRVSYIEMSVFKWFWRVEGSKILLISLWRHVQ